MTEQHRRLILYVDGGARGNPGPAGAGVVIETPDGAVLHEGGVFLGRATNNVAEYRGLLAGLSAARRLGGREVEVVSDSELLVRQMTGQYRVKNATLKRLFTQARRLTRAFAECSYRHVPREENPRADELANQAINLGENVGDERR